ncbi:REP-associated tyrosine transposase [Ekhidna sp.]|uniref:REP-associated tyrosine transposase n=1 Tax=Ekhidna sp. TaxID=2608089 RepID=UPI003C7D271A
MGLRNRNLFDDKHVFFITTTCNRWLPLIAIGNGYQIVFKSLNFCLQKYKSKMLGYVIMPNHLHMIIYFTEGKHRSNFMRDFKKYTSTMLRKEIEKYKPDLLSQLRKEETKAIFKVWQDRFDEVYLEDRGLLETKLDYIHHNPVQGKWRLVEDPVEYPYSSMAYYEKNESGFIPIDHYRDFV